MSNEPRYREAAQTGEPRKEAGHRVRQDWFLTIGIRTRRQRAGPLPSAGDGTFHRGVVIPVSTTLLGLQNARKPHHDHEANDEE
jgi:hypothetical protein